MRKPVFALVAMVLGVIVVQSVFATHFRYGHTTWHSTGGNKVEVTIQNGWRRDADGCVSKTVFVSAATRVPCTGASGLAGVGDIIVEETGGSQWNWGAGGTTSQVVGSPYGPLLYKVTSVDVAANWLFALAVDPTIGPSVGTPYGSDTTFNYTYNSSGSKPHSSKIAVDCRGPRVV